MALGAILLPARAGREVQAGGFVRGAADVPGADDAVAVGDGEIEQAARVEGGAVVRAGGNGGDQGVDAVDGLEQGLAEHRVPEPAVVADGLGARVVSGFLQAVEEEGEGPFAVGAAAYLVEPFGGDGHGECALDVLPAADVAVVHPHQAAVVEGVAVAVGQGAFGRGSHVSEDQGGGRFRGQSF